MKTTRISILLLLIIGITAFSWKSTQDKLCDVRNTALASGEKVTYKIAYKWGALWLSAGEVVFTLDNAKYGNREVYHAKGYGYTHKSYDWLFKVRDTYESYFDKESLMPYKFVRDVNEGNASFYQNVTFKHDQGKATSLKGTYNIPSCTQDIMSAIYYTRCIDWNKYKKNDTVPITVFLDDVVHPLYVRYIGKEKISVKSGTYNCIVFKPLLIKGTVFKGGEEMTVYVTDDENKIPVLVKSPILIGDIRAEVHEISGTKSPLKSKVKS
ncbi:MAG: DUF3108 domain-containing protein [Bacteroidota bacterium]|jgi:hypothetical protein